MEYTLLEFQERASKDLISKIRLAQRNYDEAGERGAVVLSAVTGAGKTVIATSVIEQLLFGGDYTDPVEGTVILWITDDPSLNRQTADKMQAASRQLQWFHFIGQGSKVDIPRFEPGHIYLMNTQAARRGSRIYKSSDRQENSIWDTIAATVEAYGSSFIVFVDEAHRGAVDSKDRPTVVNQLVNGKHPIPVFVGVSATPGLLDKALKDASEESQRVVRRVDVPWEDVRDSGLVKDRIVFHNPTDSVAADTTLVRIGVQRTLEIEQAWANYAAAQDEPAVIPAMVIQVPNNVSNDDLRAVTDAVLNEWPDLRARNIVNVFEGHTVIDLDGSRGIRYMAPQDIADDTEVRVVLAKNAITTGWDCPRAEVLVSLRKSTEFTPIAQLVGRTVRQPLARRIQDNEALNSVYCLLPHFDKEAVSRVAAQFGGGGNAVFDTVRLAFDFGFSEGPVYDSAREVLEELPSYLVPSQLPAPGVRRLHQLAAALELDGIMSGAIREADLLINKRLDYEASKLGDEFEQLRQQVAVVSIEQRTIDLAGETTHTDEFDARLDTHNVDDLYKKAQRRLVDGAASRYWDYLTGADEDDAVEHKITVAALASSDVAVDGVNAEADKVVSDWLKQHGLAVSKLGESRLVVYDRIREQATEPRERQIRLSSQIEVAVTVEDATDGDDAAVRATIEADSDIWWQKHIYAGSDARFLVVKANAPERAVLNIELAGSAVAWYRNPPGGARSLAVPYWDSTRDRYASMFPDFVFFHEVDGELRPSIVDPHGAWLPDSEAKLLGLIDYAEKHGNEFLAITAVDVVDGQLMALPLHDSNTRKIVREKLEAGASSEQLFQNNVAVHYTA